MRCAFCGKEMEDGAVVCDACGSTVIESTPEEREAIAQNEKKAGKSKLPVLFSILSVSLSVLAVLVTVVFLLAKGAHRFYAEYGFGVESLPVAGLGLAIAALVMIKKATKFKLVIALGIVGILLAVASFIFCGYVWLVVAVSVGLQDGFNNAGNGAIMPIVMSLMC